MPAPVALSVLEVDLGPGVRAGFTDRSGGVSAGPWAGLDLALHVGDDPDAVRRNRALLAGWLGASVTFPHQVHGTDVLVLGSGPDPRPDPRPDHEPDHEPDPTGGAPGSDAVIARDPGQAVGVLVADCVPVLLADPRVGLVAAAHAGRRGLLAGVLERTVAAMLELGGDPDRVRAAIGPAAGACCYEVPDDLCREAASRLPALRSRTRWGTASLDLAAGCRAALASVGVHRVQTVPVCTIDDERYFSYRRSAVTGRFCGVIRLLP